MTQALRKTKLTFDEFIAWYPENSERRYELHDGVIVEMPLPKGGHEKVVGFLVKKLNVEVDRLNLPYFVPKTVIVRPLENQSGYSPDVLLLNDSNLVNEPIWERESIITQVLKKMYCSHLTFKGMTKSKRIKPKLLMPEKCPRCQLLVNPYLIKGKKLWGHNG